MMRRDTHDDSDAAHELALSHMQPLASQERSKPPDPASLAKQRRLVESMAIYAHSRSSRVLSESDVLVLIEATPPLQELLVF